LTEVFVLGSALIAGMGIWCLCYSTVG